MDHDFMNMVGKKFSRLTVVNEVGRDRFSMVIWMCRCDCGTAKVIRGCSLRSGNTKSCGCLQKDVARNLISERNMVHGMTIGGRPSKEYTAWWQMIQRCTNHNNPKYPSYGGRGITVCERWLHSVTAFLEDVGPRPIGDYSIERINNDKGYEPGNCMWATRTQQQQNTRRNRMVLFGGEVLCASELARRLGKTRRYIYYHLKRGDFVGATV